MIPKIIHYCWFGKNSKSELIKKCIESWKYFCPDYKIIEWNEGNFDVNISLYCKEAYENKKWAFVSDYARHYILNNYGGIYLDTDVELLKNIDVFLNTNFIGFENKNSVASGLIFGCEKNNSFCKYMLERYNAEHFVLSRGKLNTDVTVCNRTTEYFKKRGLKLDGSKQFIDGFMFYPTEYFCPIDPITQTSNITSNTFSIHHYAGTWCTEEQIHYLKLRSQYAKKHSRPIASIIAFYVCEREKKNRFLAFFSTIKKIFEYILKRFNRK